MDITSIRFAVLLRRLLLITTVLWFACAQAAPLTLVVDSTGDFIDKNIGDGICADILNQCTLRAAISETNAWPGADTIEFSIPGIPPYVIDILGTPLPAITGSLLIDGSSQPGFVATPLIEITLGPVAADGLVINASGVDVFSLSITSMGGNGLAIHANSAIIDGCFIGVSVDGSAAGNGADGIFVDASFALIGGARGNVISANSINGVRVIAPGNQNTFRNNKIGVNSTGNARMPNGSAGIVIVDSANNTIGSSSGDGNVISGNITGVDLAGSGTFNNRLLGNKIGTNALGNAALGNDIYGVFLETGAHGNHIGGGLAGQGNLISGNGEGVLVTGATTSNNSIQGNIIGLNASGNAAIANSWGVDLVSLSSSTTVGGPNGGDGNVISGNISEGIRIGQDVSDSSSGNHILGNLIGTDSSGNVAIGNGTGIVVNGGADNLIGTDGAVLRGNTISGNSNMGIFLRTGNTQVRSNRIGSNATATAALSNGSENVLINGNGLQIGPNNLIAGIIDFGIDVIGNNNFISLNTIGMAGGVLDPGGNMTGITILGSGNQVLSNDITASLNRGIFVDNGTDNHISKNLMFDDGGLPVDLSSGGFGRTANDPGDADSGPNNLQNFPELSFAQYDVGGDTLSVDLRVDSDPVNAVYPLTVDIFLTDSAGLEPRSWLGAITYSTADFTTGIVNFPISPAHAIGPGSQIVAQAADINGNSSEISDAQVIAFLGNPDILFEDSFE